MNKFKVWFSKTHIFNKIGWRYWRYGTAVLVVASATAIEFLLAHLCGIETPFLIMFAAVIVSALYGGMRAGILGTVLSALICYYFFSTPTYTSIDKPAEQNFLLIVFIIEGLLISGTISTLQSTQERLKLELTAIKGHEAERDRLIAQLQLERSRLETILEQMPVGIAIADAATGQIVFGNQEMEKIFRHPLIPAQNIEQYQQYKTFYPDGRPYQPQETVLARTITRFEVIKDEEVTILRGDGTYGTILVNSTPLYDAEGKIAAGIVAFLDISERQAALRDCAERTAGGNRKQAQEQLSNLNAILEERVRERTAQLEQARTEVQLSFNRLKGIIESTNDIIAALDLDFRLIAFNTAFKKELSEVFDREAQLGMNLLDAFAHLPVEQAKVKTLWGRALQGEQFTTIEEFSSPDLESHYYEINFSSIKDENHQLIGACQTVRNVTERILNEQRIRNLNQELEQRVIERTQALETEIQERIKIEAKLRESEEKFRATFNQAAVGIAHTTLDGKYQIINQKLCDIFGYSQEEIVNLSIADVTYSEDLDADRENVRRMVANEIQSFSIEKRYIRKDGSLIWGNLTVSLAREASGEPKYLIGVVEDITDRKQAELALQESTAILNAINTSTPTLIYAKDPEGRFLMANPASLALLGALEEEIIGKTTSDYLVNSEQALQIVANDRLVIETGQQLVYEETADLSVGRRTYLSTKSPYRDKEGNIIGLIGISVDITDRKQFEEIIQAKNREITNILDSITDGFINLDRDWRYTYVNSKAEEILGKQKNDLLGNNAWEVFPEATYLPGYQYCYQAINEQVSIEYEEFNPFLDKWLNVRLYPSAEGLTLYFQDISERKKAEIALKLSEAKFRRLTDANVVGIIVANYTGEIVEANDAFLQMLGYTRSDRDAGEVNWRHITPPEYFTQDVEKWQELQQTGKVSFEKEYLHKNGSRVPVLIAAAMLEENQEAAICMVVDLAERKQAENALRESERRFRNLADSMPQIVWTANPAGEVDYYNQRVHEFSGFSQQADGTWKWQPVLHPDDEQRTLEVWQQALETGQIYECEHRLKKIDGEFRWYLSRGMPVKDERGCITKWYGTATDIHAQKQYQAEREQLLQREQAARTEAELASRLKDEFLATLSHELRTPMNAMLGWTSILRTRKVNEATSARALETIERNTKTLNQLIEDILDVSRIIRGKVRLNLQPLQLVPAIEQAIETLKPTAAAKDIQILVEPLDVNSLQVMGDSSRLQQIFWNLLSNAIKFTSNGGCVTVKFSEAIEEREENAQFPIAKFARIQVSDNGIGIASEFLPYVFDRFRQADGSITRSHGGLGLGLAIVRHLVELHGGTVRVHSLGVGQGATFSVNLPLIVESSTTGRQENKAEDSIQFYSDPFLLKDLQVLVVDDEPDVRDLVSVILEDRGAKVTAVASVKEALAALPKLRPNIIVSDIGMPEADGYSLIRQIRKLPKETGGQIPALALTAYASAEDRNAAIAAGFNRHIAKPIDPTELTIAIAILGRKN